jgi:hypothetical protein
MTLTLEESNKHQHTFTLYIAFLLTILGSGAISYGYTAAIIGTTLGKYPSQSPTLVLIMLYLEPCTDTNIQDNHHLSHTLS